MSFQYSRVSEDCESIGVIHFVPDHQNQRFQECCLCALNNCIGQEAFTREHFKSVRDKDHTWGMEEIRTLVGQDPRYTYIEFGANMNWVEVFQIYPGFLGYVVNQNGAHWVAIKYDRDE
mmetsp:Transcript_45023/g.67827  ORF Transcript_45023/g.67827 Transcript_45023/m.67827 type:complete len:119 (-) Transcript_45023:256-612(-)